MGVKIITSEFATKEPVARLCRGLLWPCPAPRGPRGGGFIRPIIKVREKVGTATGNGNQTRFCENLGLARLIWGQADLMIFTVGDW